MQQSKALSLAAILTLSVLSAACSKRDDVPPPAPGTTSTAPAPAPAPATVPPPPLPDASAAMDAASQPPVSTSPASAPN